jgi:hypothetical protein
MELVVDLTSGAVTLEDPEDLQAFAVQVVGPRAAEGPGHGALGALAAALSVHDAGTVTPDGDVLVPVEAVRRLAGRSAAHRGRTLGPRWESGLTAMLEYASAHGWVDDDGAVRAHVEWGS